MKRFLIFMILGPLIGAAVGYLFVLPVLIMGHAPIFLDLYFMFVTLPMIYFAGLMPALGAAILDQYLAARGTRYRIVWTALGGAAATLPMMVTVAMITVFLTSNWWLWIPAMGAVSAGLCAWLSGDRMR